MPRNDDGGAKCRKSSGDNISYKIIGNGLVIYRDPAFTSITSFALILLSLMETKTKVESLSRMTVQRWLNPALECQVQKHQDGLSL